MTNLQPTRFMESDKLFYKHLTDEGDIFSDTFKLRDRCEYESEAYNLLNEVIDMNIEIGELRNKTTANLKKVRKLLKATFVEELTI